MDKPKPLLLKKLAQLLSETMGQETGQLYLNFYEYDNPDAMIAGAKAVLEELMGPDRAEQKISEVVKQ